MVKKYVGLEYSDNLGVVNNLGIFDTLEAYFEFRTKNKKWNSEVFPFYQ